MISQQLNDQITRIGPNDDAGLLLRQYWQPAALCDDIAFGLPFAVNLLSEQLALVKDRSGFKLVTRLLDENYSPTVIPRLKKHHPFRPLWFQPIQQVFPYLPLPLPRAGYLTV